MLDDFKTNKSRVQQFGLSTTIKDDSGNEHHFYRGHEYVEIGGLKWAVTNVGSNTETDNGLYFAFGETKGYTAEQICNGERKFIKEEYTNVNFDAVNVYWGEKWRLPTEAEFRALLSSTTHKWVENYQGSGVDGKLFTDKTDGSKKLFFPAYSCCLNGEVRCVGYFGSYWSSSFNASDMTIGRSFNYGRYHSVTNNSYCYLGFSVRGVIGD